MNNTLDKTNHLVQLIKDQAGLTRTEKRKLINVALKNKAKASIKGNVKQAINTVESADPETTALIKDSYTKAKGSVHTARRAFDAGKRASQILKMDNNEKKNLALNTTKNLVKNEAFSLLSGPLAPALTVLNSAKSAASLGESIVGVEQTRKARIKKREEAEQKKAEAEQKAKEKQQEKDLKQAQKEADKRQKDLMKQLERLEAKAQKEAEQERKQREREEAKQKKYEETHYLQSNGEEFHKRKAINVADATKRVEKARDSFVKHMFDLVTPYLFASNTGSPVSMADVYKQRKSSWSAGMKANYARFKKGLNQTIDELIKAAAQMDMKRQQAWIKYALTQQQKEIEAVKQKELKDFSNKRDESYYNEKIQKIREKYQKKMSVDANHLRALYDGMKTLMKDQGIVRSWGLGDEQAIYQSDQLESGEKVFGGITEFIYNVETYLTDVMMNAPETMSQDKGWIETFNR